MKVIVMKLTIRTDIAAALWRGMTGTPEELAKELGYTARQVSDAMPSIRAMDWVRRERVGRTFRYSAMVTSTSTPRLAVRRSTQNTQAAHAEPVGFDFDMGWLIWNR